MKKTLLSLLASLPLLAGAQTTAPTMGWSSWNTYATRISDQLIKHQADCMVSTGLKAAGYTYINIDDGYQGGRDAQGNLLFNPHRFPTGLRHVVDHIHGLGLKAGIYSDAGRSTCANYYGGDSLSWNVGFYGHDQQDANLFFKQLDFDFIKIDFCGGDAPQNRERLALDEQQRYTEIRRAIDATGRSHVRMNVCRWNYPGTWVDGVSDSWRTTHDIYDSWKSVRGILLENLALSAYSSDGHYNDMDMLEVGRSLSLEEDKTHFGMWCIMESPLLIGCDLGRIKPQTLDLLKNPELIALNQAEPRQQAYPVAKSDGCYILVKDVETAGGVKRAVAFFNPEDRDAVATLRFSDVDLAGTVSARSVFMRREAGRFAGGQMRVEVPRHGCRIYVLTGERRTDRRRYEAETAYISDYQELWNNQAKKTGIYEMDPQCSSGMKATWLGCSLQNDLQWKHVRVSKAGTYTLAFGYLSPDSRTFSVSVNGAQARQLAVEGRGTAAVKVRLQAGDNVVRLYNENGWMPDFDYMDVTR